MNRKAQGDCRRIVELLLECAPGYGGYSNLQMGKRLNLANPAARTSDARKYGAPITDEWITRGNKKFKAYFLTSKKAAREWLKRWNP